MGCKSDFSQICAYALLLTASGLVSQPRFALADPVLSGAALESPVGRYLLGETAQGLELMAKILGREAAPSDVDEFLNRFRDAKSSEASQLEERISAIRSDLHRAQVQRSGGQSVPESDAFTGEERFALREAAARELQIDSRWQSADPQPGQIDFTDPDHAGGLNASRSEFLAPTDEKTITLDEKPGEQAPEEIKERAKRGLREWYNDSQSCLQNRSAAASSSAEWKYLAQQWLISGGTTTVGYLATTGITRANLGGFGLDMLMSLVSQGVSMMWMGSKDSFEVRWLKVFAWGHGRADLDAEVYRISPWTNTQGVPMDQAVTTRRDYNYSWNAKTSWVSPVMYSVLNGIDCLLDQETGAAAVARAARFRKGAFIFRTGVSVGTSVLYYKLSPKAHK